MIEIFLLILQTLTGFVTTTLLARAWLRWQRISFINPFGHFILVTTNWIVLPAQRFIPSAGRLDLSAVLPAWFLQMLLTLIHAALISTHFKAPILVLLGLLLIGALNVVQVVLHMLLGAIIIVVVLSWVNPQSPIAPIFNRLVDPLLVPFRRIIPVTSGVDFSPMILSLILWVCVSQFPHPLYRFGGLLFV